MGKTPQNMPQSSTYPIITREYWATLAEELRNHPPQGDYRTPPPKMAL